MRERAVGERLPRRRRPDEEREQAVHAPAPAVPVALDPATAALLHLQGAAGNAAVARLVGADRAGGAPSGPAVQRQRPAARETAEQRRRRRLEEAEEETLTLNGIAGGRAAWIAEMQTITFLDRTVTVHRLLAERLALAEQALANETPPRGGWLRQDPSGRRDPGQSLHSYGLAIDLNASTNPWLINPDARGAGDIENAERSRAIRDIIERALLLVLGRTAAQADFQSRPRNRDPHARVGASYDKLSEASGALRRYFQLGEADQRTQLEALAARVRDRDPDGRDADAWAATIAQDRESLGTHAAAKSWARPTSGFLDLDRRLVMAMTDPAGAGLTWLGDATVATGRDIMHFDTRGAGPITRIIRQPGADPVNLGS